MQYLLVFLEGIITFVSPCLLPMLPVYVMYFAGGTNNGKKTLRNSLAFVLGFTLVFILLGALAGTLGSFLTRYSNLVNIVTGLIVVFFGLNYLGVFKLNIFRGNKIKAKRDMSFFSSLIFGVTFSVGWTPCVGAFLGSALMLATKNGRVLDGIIMLFLYSLGLGIPFIASAVLIDKLKSTFNFIKRNYRVINAVCGVLLIVIGILMITGLFGKFIYYLA